MGERIFKLETPTHLGGHLILLDKEKKEVLWGPNAKTEEGKEEGFCDGEEEPCGMVEQLKWEKRGCGVGDEEGVHLRKVLKGRLPSKTTFPY